jgi:tetratricopeptide (TPR) repeat protein
LIAAFCLCIVAHAAAGQNPAAPSMFRGTPSTAAHMISVTTAVPAAEEHFLMGIQALDAEKNAIALGHFQEAIKADGSFALAHLYAAIANPSLGGYKTHLDHALQRASGASRAEQLMITIEQRAFANDLDGRLEAAQELVAAAPKEPRAYQALARAHSALRRIPEKRDALVKAVQLSPDFAGLHVELANSFIQEEPRDLAQATTHMNHAVSLEPNASYVHDYMGDLYRAKNELEKARSEYTRVAELDPTGAIGFQQRGHVNAFLGNFTEARADYDRAIALATPEQKAGFMGTRALVGVYAGDPGSAEKELDAAYAAVDGTGHPNPTGAKIGLMNDQFLIAFHNKHLDVAHKAADRLASDWRDQARIAGTATMQGLADASSAYAGGLLALLKGDFGTARVRAKDYMQARQAENNPRKNEAAHGLLALSDFMEGHPERSLAHFAEISPDNVYYTYYHALALERVGRNAEAQVLFRRVAERNFSSAQVALTKKAAASHVK